MSLKHIEYLKIGVSNLLVVEIRPLPCYLDTSTSSVLTTKWMNYDHWQELQGLLTGVVNEYELQKTRKYVTNKIKCDDPSIERGASIRIGYMFTKYHKCPCLTPQAQRWRDEEEEEDETAPSDEDDLYSGLEPCTEMLVVSVCMNNLITGISCTQGYSEPNQRDILSLDLQLIKTLRRNGLRTQRKDRPSRNRNTENEVEELPVKLPSLTPISLCRKLNVPQNPTTHSDTEFCTDSAPNFSTNRESVENCVSVEDDTVLIRSYITDSQELSVISHTKANPGAVRPDGLEVDDVWLDGLGPRDVLSDTDGPGDDWQDGLGSHDDRQDNYGPRDDRQDGLWCLDDRQDGLGSRDDWQDGYGTGDDRQDGLGSRNDWQDGYQSGDDRQDNLGPHDDRQDSLGSRNDQPDSYEIGDDRQDCVEIADVFPDSYGQDCLWSRDDRLPRLCKIKSKQSKGKIDSTNTLKDSNSQHKIDSEDETDSMSRNINRKSPPSLSKNQSKRKIDSTNTLKDSQDFSLELVRSIGENRNHYALPSHRKMGKALKRLGKRSNEIEYIGEGKNDEINQSSSLDQCLNQYVVPLRFFERNLVNSEGGESENIQSFSLDQSLNQSMSPLRLFRNDSDSNSGGNKSWSENEIEIYCEDGEVNQSSHNINQSIGEIYCEDGEVNQNSHNINQSVGTLRLNREIDYNTEDSNEDWGISDSLPNLEYSRLESQERAQDSPQESQDLLGYNTGLEEEFERSQEIAQDSPQESQDLLGHETGPDIKFESSQDVQESQERSQESQEQSQDYPQEGDLLDFNTGEEFERSQESPNLLCYNTGLGKEFESSQDVQESQERSQDGPQEFQGLLGYETEEFERSQDNPQEEGVLDYCTGEEFERRLQDTPQEFQGFLGYETGPEISQEESQNAPQEECQSFLGYGTGEEFECSQDNPQEFKGLLGYKTRQEKSQDGPQEEGVLGYGTGEEFERSQDTPQEFKGLLGYKTGLEKSQEEPQENQSITGESEDSCSFQGFETGLKSQEKLQKNQSSQEHQKNHRKKSQHREREGGGRMTREKSEKSPETRQTREKSRKKSQHKEQDLRITQEKSPKSPETQPTQEKSPKFPETQKTHRIKSQHIEKEERPTQEKSQKSPEPQPIQEKSQESPETQLQMTREKSLEILSRKAEEKSQKSSETQFSLKSRLRRTAKKILSEVEQSSEEETKQKLNKKWKRKAKNSKTEEKINWLFGDAEIDVESSLIEDEEYIPKNNTPQNTTEKYNEYIPWKKINPDTENTSEKYHSLNEEKEYVPLRINTERENTHMPENTSEKYHKEKEYVPLRINTGRQNISEKYQQYKPLMKNTHIPENTSEYTKENTHISENTSEYIPLKKNNTQRNNTHISENTSEYLPLMKNITQVEYSPQIMNSPPSDNEVYGIDEYIDLGLEKSYIPTRNMSKMDGYIPESTNFDGEPYTPSYTPTFIEETNVIEDYLHTSLSSENYKEEEERRRGGEEEKRRRGEEEKRRRGEEEEEEEERREIEERRRGEEERKRRGEEERKIRGEEERKRRGEKGRKKRGEEEIKKRGKEERKRRGEDEKRIRGEEKRREEEEERRKRGEEEKQKRFYVHTDKFGKEQIFFETEINMTPSERKKYFENLIDKGELHKMKNKEVLLRKWPSRRVSVDLFASETDSHHSLGQNYETNTALCPRESEGPSTSQNKQDNSSDTEGELRECIASLMCRKIPDVGNDDALKHTKRTRTPKKCGCNDGSDLQKCSITVLKNRDRICTEPITNSSENVQKKTDVEDCGSTVPKKRKKCTEPAISSSENVPKNIDVDECGSTVPKKRKKCTEPETNSSENVQKKTDIEDYSTVPKKRKKCTKPETNSENKSKIVGDSSKENVQEKTDIPDYSSTVPKKDISDHSSSTVPKKRKKCTNSSENSSRIECDGSSENVQEKKDIPDCGSTVPKKHKKYTKPDSSTGENKTENSTKTDDFSSENKTKIDGRNNSEKEPKKRKKKCTKTGKKKSDNDSESDIQNSSEVVRRQPQRKCSALPIPVPISSVDGCECDGSEEEWDKHDNYKWTYKRSDKCKCYSKNVSNIPDDSGDIPKINTIENCTSKVVLEELELKYDLEYNSSQNKANIYHCENVPKTNIHWSSKVVIEKLKMKYSSTDNNESSIRENVKKKCENEKKNNIAGGHIQSSSTVPKKRKRKSTKSQNSSENENKIDTCENIKKEIGIENGENNKENRLKNSLSSSSNSSSSLNTKGEENSKPKPKPKRKRNRSKKSEEAKNTEPNTNPQLTKDIGEIKISEIKREIVDEIDVEYARLKKDFEEIKKKSELRDRLTEENEKNEDNEEIKQSLESAKKGSGTKTQPKKRSRTRKVPANQTRLTDWISKDTNKTEWLKQGKQGQNKQTNPSTKIDLNEASGDESDFKENVKRKRVKQTKQPKLDSLEAPKSPIFKTKFTKMNKATSTLKPPSKASKMTKSHSKTCRTLKSPSKTSRTLKSPTKTSSKIAKSPSKTTRTLKSPSKTPRTLKSPSKTSRPLKSPSKTSAGTSKSPKKSTESKSKPSRKRKEKLTVVALAAQHDLSLLINMDGPPILIEENIHKAQNISKESDTSKNDEMLDGLIEGFHKLQAMTIDDLKATLNQEAAYLRRIMRGYEVNERHQMFRDNERQLSYMSIEMIYGPYSEEQISYVAESIIDMFSDLTCKFSSVFSYHDYVWKVLAPSFLIKIVMNNEGVSHDEAERILVKFSTDSNINKS